MAKNKNNTTQNKTVTILWEKKFPAFYMGGEIMDFDGERIPIQKGDLIQVRSRIGKGLGLFKVVDLGYAILILDDQHQPRQIRIGNGSKIQPILFGE